MIRVSIIKKTLMFFILIILVSTQGFSKEIRVVSLAPSITEILFAIGLDEKEIVGVTNYCDYPPRVNRILKVGSLTTVNIEKVVSLKPDYVFSVGNEFSPLNLRIKKAGLNVVVLNSETIKEVFSSILTIGKILKREENAERLVGQLNNRLNEIEKRVQKIKDRKKVYIEIWGDPITSCGKGSLVNEVVTKAGGINISAKLDMLYPTINQEVIIKENPDYIILGYMNRGQKEIVSAVLKRPGWQDINAVKTKNVICDIDPNIFLRPGPRIIDGIEQIHNKIYGNK